MITHADRHRGDVEIVSRRVEGDVHRTTYRELHRRSWQLANALDSLGLRACDRIATLAWNGYRHMELYFAASGSGAVLHTINARLHSETDCMDRQRCRRPRDVLRPGLAATVEAVAPHCRMVQHWVAMTDRAHMPAISKVTDLKCYEDVIGSHSDRYRWSEFDDAVFVESIPLGATGKMLKTRLREQFADYKLPTV